MDSGLLDQFISEATDLTPSVDQRMLHQKDGVSVLAKKATGRRLENLGRVREEAKALVSIQGRQNSLDTPFVPVPRHGGRDCT